MFCFGRQIILDVAMTVIDGQSRTSDDLPDRPLQVRYEQKMAKYGHIADQNRLQFVPAVFFTLNKFMKMGESALAGQSVLVF